MKDNKFGAYQIDETMLFLFCKEKNEIIWVMDTMIITGMLKCYYDLIRIKNTIKWWNISVAYKRKGQIAIFGKKVLWKKALIENWKEDIGCTRNRKTFETESYIKQMFNG